MCRIFNFFKSSIGRKQLMAATGQSLCAFLLVHLAGNLSIFLGEAKFNGYAEALEHNPLLIPAEIVLALLFILHIASAIKLTLDNSAARPQKYEMNNSVGEGTFASTTMILTGLMILIFLLVHLYNFKLPHLMESEGPHELYGLVIGLFQNIGWTVFYVFSIIVLGIHVSHGFQSAFQSLGLNHPTYTPMIKKISYLYAILIVVGFSSIPLWAYFIHGGF